MSEPRGAGGWRLPPLPLSVSTKTPASLSFSSYSLLCPPAHPPRFKTFQCLWQGATRALCLTFYFVLLSSCAISIMYDFSIFTLSPFSRHRRMPADLWSHHVQWLLFLSSSVAQIAQDLPCGPWLVSCRRGTSWLDWHSECSIRLSTSVIPQCLSTHLNRTYPDVLFHFFVVVLVLFYA